MHCMYSPCFKFRREIAFRRQPMHYYFSQTTFTMKKHRILSITLTLSSNLLGAPHLMVLGATTNLPPTTAPLHGKQLQSESDSESAYLADHSSLSVEEAFRKRQRHLNSVAIVASVNVLINTFRPDPYISWEVRA
jgi:hypothetical protein